MVKNSAGGNKAKRKGRKKFKHKTFSLDDLKASPADNQEYAYVTEKLGDGRYHLLCYDKVSRLGIVRGTIKKSSRINKGDFILVSLRPFEDQKCDILYRYTEDDVNKLLHSTTIESSFIKNGKLSADIEEDDGGVQTVSTIEQPMSDSDSASNHSSAWKDDDDDDDNKGISGVVNKYDDEINIDDI